MADPSPVQMIPNEYRHYGPLNSNDKEIRLLRILPAASDDDILVVAVFRTNLADCPGYRALSYCWGSLEETREIAVTFQNEDYVDSTWKEDNICAFDNAFHTGLNNTNGTPLVMFNITANLHLALCSFRRSKMMGFLWADMLYINQGDVNERSSQVGIMKSIYATADLVVVWLGNDQEVHSALFAVDNYELTLFSLALEGAGWNSAVKSLQKFVLKVYVERLQRGEKSQLYPAESIRSSPFIRFLCRNISKIRLVSSQERKAGGSERTPDAEIDEQFRETFEAFLLWLHLPFLEFVEGDSWLDRRFRTYWRSIVDHRSAMWQWLEFSIASQLKVITHDRLLQPPQNIICQ